jgi:hypothetical protein
MRKPHAVSPDDVEKLIRGKPSTSRAGSRHIRHRLRQDELSRLSIARARGFLLVTPSTRTALRNSWYLDCLARGKPCLYVARSSHGFDITGADTLADLNRACITLEEVSAFVEATLKDSAWREASCSTVLSSSSAEGSEM